MGLHLREWILMLSVHEENIGPSLTFPFREVIQSMVGDKHTENAHQHKLCTLRVIYECTAPSGHGNHMIDMNGKSQVYTNSVHLFSSENGRG